MISGIIVEKQTGLVNGSFGNDNQMAFIWENWDVPKYDERLKKSYYIIKDYFGKDD